MKIFTRRAAAVAVFLTLPGCASGPTPSASVAPAAGRPAAPKKGIVLVEAKGTPTELERFLTRFLSEASDRGLGAIVDGRLSGAHLADVGAPGEAGAEFRKAWPADVYLGVMLAPCTIQRREGRTNERQTNVMTGVPTRVENVFVSYEADCPVSVSVVTAPGAAAKLIDVKGRNSSSDVSSLDTEAEAQAAEDAAERAVKKLAAALR